MESPELTMVVADVDDQVLVELGPEISLLSGP